MRSGREIFGKIIPAAAENLPRLHPAPTLERPATPETALPLINRLISPETRQILDEQLEQLPDGRYYKRDVVGDQEQGTRHLHDFLIEKAGAESDLYWIDPEHAVGKNRNRSLIPRRGDFRPNISVLYATRLRKGDPVPDISIIRYRTKEVVERGDAKSLKMEPQFEMARQLLRTGATPPLLEGLEKEVTFKLNVRKDAMSVSRNALPGNLERFLKGEPSTSIVDGLDGLAHTYSVIMGHYFPKYLQEGSFSPLDVDAYP